jgi:6-phosphogluconolactonase (cycloisomerase 2 family)
MPRLSYTSPGPWILFAVASTLLNTPLLIAQATGSAVFVANNGNLEGSVTALKVGADGSLDFVNRVVTGTPASLSDPCAGCNAYEITLTPDGKYLAACHAAGDLDGITILSVSAAGSVSQVLQLPLPSGLGTPIDIVWIDNQYLATLRTDTSPDRVVTYSFNPTVPSLTEVSSLPLAGNSSAYLARHPSGQFIYANDSSLKVVYALQVGAGGVLTQIDAESSGTPFPLEIQISPDGTRLYSAGGISNGGHSVIGMNILPDGTLNGMTGTPFTSPGSSPSNVFVNGDGSLLVVGHGTDATAWTFSIDQGTGAVTSTGNMFDVGLQGTLGDVHCSGNLVFITDNSTATDGVMGIYSFTLGAAGTLTQNGPILSTQGTAPRGIIAWIPTDTDGDMNCDNLVDLNDVDPMVMALLSPEAYAAHYPGCNAQRGDVNDDGEFDGLDIGPFAELLLP